MNEAVVSDLKMRIAEFEYMFARCANSGGTGMKFPSAESTNYDLKLGEFGVSRAGMGKMLQHEIDTAVEELEALNAQA